MTLRSGANPTTLEGIAEYWQNTRLTTGRVDIDLQDAKNAMEIDFFSLLSVCSVVKIFEELDRNIIALN